MSNVELSKEEKVRAKALEYFTSYFVNNYPGPNTIISDPRWHAPKIFRGMEWALKQAASDVERGE